MLENEAALRTWRLAQPPTDGGIIAAEALADHRLAYLDYEGPVSGNRGAVTAFDRGEYSLLTDVDAIVKIELRGTSLKGAAVLQRLASGSHWQFVYTPRATNE